MKTYKNPDGSIVAVSVDDNCWIEEGAWIGAGARIGAGAWIDRDIPSISSHVVINMTGADRLRMGCKTYPLATWQRDFENIADRHNCPESRRPFYRAVIAMYAAMSPQIK